MAWRTILIQNPAKLALAKGQLQISTDSGNFTFPLEDIALIIAQPCRTGSYDKFFRLEFVVEIIAQPCRTGSYDVPTDSRGKHRIIAQPCRTGSYDFDQCSY